MTDTNPPPFWDEPPPRVLCCHCRASVHPEWIEAEFGRGRWRCPDCCGGWYSEEMRLAIIKAHDAGEPYPMVSEGE